MSKIDIVIKYLKSLLGIQFIKTFYPPDPNIDETSYWINTEVPLPTKKTLIKEGLNCSGMANLARRKVGLDIPGNIKGKKRYKFIGNTPAWFKYLKDNDRLEVLDMTKKYPKGSIVIKKYTPKKEGHLGIICDNKMNIIHTHPDPGYMFIEKLEENMFTHVCRPENWILKN